MLPLSTHLISHWSIPLSWIWLSRKGSMNSATDWRIVTVRIYRLTGRGFTWERRLWPDWLIFTVWMKAVTRLDYWYSENLSPDGFTCEWRLWPDLLIFTIRMHAGCDLIRLLIQWESLTCLADGLHENMACDRVGWFLQLECMQAVTWLDYWNSENLSPDGLRVNV